jgi:CheY-like chemotaxis protein
VHILLLTEEICDHKLFAECLASLSSDHRLTACTSLAEAWSGVVSRKSPLPDLIFVDFELSRDYDHELVSILKSNENLGAAPVIVVADSDDHEESAASHGLGAACVVLLPKACTLRRPKLRECLEFWTDHSELAEMRRRWRGESG